MLKMAAPTPRPRTALFIAPLPPPITGHALACQALYDDLQELGYRVKVVNLSKNSFKQGFSSSFGRVFEILWAIIKTAVHARTADKIYFTPVESIAGNLKDLGIYAVLGGRLGVTYIHLHGGAGMRRLLSNEHPWLLRMNAFFLRRISGAIVLGGRLSSVYAGIVAPERIRVVKNFAPDESFIDRPGLFRKLRDESKVRVLYLSNLLPGKGYLELVAAIKMLDAEQAACFHFDFAGGFESEQFKAEFMAEISGLGNVIYHGVVHGERKRSLLCEAHVFCLPTYYPYEGQPISILEAYASGCMVLTTDHSGIFDVFTPDVNGLQVEKMAPQSIRDGLLAAMQDRKKLCGYAIRNYREALVSYKLRIHLHNLRAAMALA